MTATPPALPPAPSVRLTTGMVAILITVILQAVATITWAAKMDGRISTVEKSLGPITDGTVARLDERTRNIEKGVERLERLATTPPR